MHKMVLQVFKVIALSMVFVFIWDIVFYLYRAFSLNQRMESINVSVQKVVSENNYLPTGQYNMFMSIYNDMGESFNKVPANADASDANVVKMNEFIVYDGNNAVTLNYNQPATNSKRIGGYKPNSYGSIDWNDNIVKNRLDAPADYGDIMCIEAKVKVNQPLWGFLDGDKMNAKNWQKGTSDDMSKFGSQYRGDGTTTFTYTYYVPCLKYQSVTN